MKLTIGAKWHKEGKGYYEELTIEGLEAISRNLDNGKVVIPESPDSFINVEITNDITAQIYYQSFRLRDLVNNWERGEAPAEMPSPYSVAVPKS